MTKQFLSDQLRRISASGIRTFRKETADDIFVELKDLPESHIKKAVDRLLQMEETPKNLIGYFFRVSKENSENVKSANPDKWWIIGESCYRCGDSGAIPELVFGKNMEGEKIVLNGFPYPATKLWECNCQNGKKFRYFNEQKKEYVYIGRQYSEKYGDEHQFPFSKEIIFSNPAKLCYQYVFSFYEYDFLKRLRENKDAQFFEKDLTDQFPKY